MKKAILTICTVAALIICFSAAHAQSGATSPAQLHVTADSEDYVPATGQFTALGNARITYRDVLLTADRVVGNAVTGDVEAAGNVCFKSAARSLRGETFSYNLNTGIGLASNAAAEADGLFFRGAELTSSPTKYRLVGSRFTTCNLEHPHYYLSARELTMEPRKRLVARGVKLVIHDKTILSLPRYRVDLRPIEERRDFRLPTIGVSSRSGVYAGYEFDIKHKPDTSGTLDVRFSSKLLIQGGLSYDSIAGKPVFLRAMYHEPYYAGTNRNSIVSRLPEIGFRFGSSALPRRYSTSTEPLSLSRELINPLSENAEPGKMRLYGEASWGAFSEQPDYTASGRLDARAMALMDAIYLAPNTLFSPGLYGRVSSYGNRDTYTDVAFRLAASQKLGERSYFSAGYIVHSTRGVTPFDFDAVELHDELGAGLVFPIGEYDLELRARYNLQQDRLFDTAVSVSRLFHCIEPRITWRNRFRQVSFNVGLVQF